MNTGGTAGYGARITLALERGPRPMSTRELARRVGKQHPELRGTSYGGIRQYAEGNIKKPRVELLRAIADALEVRADWLAFDDGHMTEDVQRVREAREAGEDPDPASEWGLDDFLRVVGEECGDADLFVDSAAEPFILETWARLLDAGLYPPGVPDGTAEETPTSPVLAIGRVLTGVPPDVPEDSRRHYVIATHLGRALHAGFAGFFPNPWVLTEAELTDYVANALQAVHRLAEAARRHLPDLPPPPPPHETGSHSPDAQEE